jgi:hypothetical protein
MHLSRPAVRRVVGPRVSSAPSSDVPLTEFVEVAAGLVEHAGAGTRRLQGNGAATLREVVVFVTSARAACAAVARKRAAGGACSGEARDDAEKHTPSLASKH